MKGKEYAETEIISLLGNQKKYCDRNCQNNHIDLLQHDQNYGHMGSKETM